MSRAFPCEAGLIALVDSGCPVAIVFEMLGWLTRTGFRQEGYEVIVVVRHLLAVVPPVISRFI